MVNGLYFKDLEIYGKIKLETKDNSETLEALIDTGAFKTLVPESTCEMLKLPRVEIKKVWGICPTPVEVNIYLVDVYFLEEKVINSVIGFDIPSKKKISLIGRDILSQFDFTIQNSDQKSHIKKF
ncbi:MAG: hypothetical protein HWN67_19310 [Candidatus Helarchaeota archaeon]|nr:hypothetical protein [Candidatus Helarchaeota archaeon]